MTALIPSRYLMRSLAAGAVLGLTSAQAWAHDGRAPSDHPAFQISLEVDLPVILTAGTLQLGWTLSGVLPPPHCAPLCDKEDLWSIDRPAAGNYSEQWGLSTDIMLAAIAAGSAGALVLDEGLRNALGDLVVVVEAMFVGNAIAVLSTLASRRPRPLMYGEAAPLKTREDPQSALSFFSGHTTMATALSVSTFSALRRRHPGRWWPWLVLGAGLAASSFVAVGRVMAGQHFPTDVIAGFVTGACAGLALSELHGSPLKAVATGSTVGLVFAWD